MEGNRKITVEHVKANSDNKPQAMRELEAAGLFVVVSMDGTVCKVTTNVPRPLSIELLKKVITAWGVNLNQN